MKSPREIAISFLHTARPLARRVMGRPRIPVREALAYIMAFTLAVATLGGILCWHNASLYAEEMTSLRVRQSSVADARAQAEYNDSWDVPVVAGTRHYPLTNSGIVHKIERAEAMKNFRRMAIAEGLGGGILVILLGSLLLFHRRGIMPRVLKPEEEKFRAFMDAAPDAMYIMDPSTLRILGRNRKAAELDGYSDEDISRMTVADLHPPEDHTLLREWLERGPEPGGVLHLHTLKRKDGYLAPVEEKQSLVDARGEQFVLSIARDITERKRAEEALIEERHLLHTLMDNLPDVIYFKDRESRFTRINMAHAKQFGLSDPAQAVGKTDFDFFTAEHAQEAYNDEQEIIRTGQPMVGKEEKETWPDGHVTWVSTTKMPLRDANGNIIGTFGVSRDITERKRAEEALRDSEEKYRVLYESSRDAIMMLAPPEWEFTAGNPAAIALFGARDEREFVAAAPWSLSPEYQPDGELSSVKARQMIDVAMERGSHFFEWTHKKFSGEEFFATVTLTRMIYRGQPLLQATVRDITERKRAEAEMAERHRLATLVAEVGVALTRAESLRQGLQQCAEILVRNIGAAFARVWTVNEEENVLELQASAGMYTHLDGGHARVPVGKFKIGRIAENGEPHLTNSVQEDSWVGDPEWARREGMVAFAGYPLKVEGCVLGVVAAFARQPLTEATLQAFASVADNIAQFIKRKRAEQQTRLQTAALESAANGIVIASPEGRIIWVNPAFTRLTGYPASEVIGKNPRVLKSGVHDTVFYQELWDTILSGEVWQGEIVNRRKDGTLLHRGNDHHSRARHPGNHHSFHCHQAGHYRTQAGGRGTPAGEPRPPND